jgi:transposase InsO family protein
MLIALLGFLRSLFRARRELALENLALRQQLVVLRRAKRPRLINADRIFWAWLSRVWAHWSDVLVIVRPDTVVRWHRRGFRLFWRWKAQQGPGRPPASKEVRDLIRRMATENLGWGAPRIHGELLKLGIDVSERTVSRLMPHRRKPPSQTWRTFLANHAGTLACIDFLAVHTASFRVLYVFLVLSVDRRRVVHWNLTSTASAEWTAQQIVDAFPEDTAPRYLLRDRDGVYAAAFSKRIAGLGIEEVKTAPRSPWQNPFAERLVGSIRRECLDHVIVLGEAHLRVILKAYFVYYHRARTHLSLGKDAPDPRLAQPPGAGEIVAFPEVGGLHHRYERRAA